ncbi:DUF4864 domain-containing protein [Ramlibacter sp. AW1]|uniref:DUF4864 domain-containing protein n=1 Tax=Ramlibacter aurantiacus TaxID=2801330 RepID=A0A937D413_9BURK|nr:DUF4864 domain-containing protein [Ramlibacter aurantiacus]MBL0419887.1 DUF4864 domain-containing protein [Ramlibacter aurantiacus]
MNTFPLHRLLLPVALALTAGTMTATASEPIMQRISEPALPRAVIDELLPAAEATEVRKVIIAQIEAMAQSDAERMFDTTTPRVREAVGSSGRFLAMMMGAYPMVYQPSQVNFHPPRRKSDGAFQLVEIKDRDDNSWLAVFILEQQPDRSWRISGCAVTQNPWMPA